MAWKASGLFLISCTWFASGNLEPQLDEALASKEACVSETRVKAVVDDLEEAGNTLSLLQVSSKANVSVSTKGTGHGGVLSLLAGTGQHVHAGAHVSVGAHMSDKAHTEMLMSTDLMADEALGFRWIMLSPLASCEYNKEGIPVAHGEGGLNLRQCKSKCMARSSCEAIDFYANTAWCNMYDKACSGPTTVKDGASSHRLNRTLAFSQMNASVRSRQVTSSHSSDSRKWSAISWTAACEENSQGIPDIFSQGGFSFARCKDKCVDTDKCVAIDYYSHTGWCILYDTACTTPLKVKDGSSSHRLVDMDHHMSLMERALFPTATASAKDVEKFMIEFGSPWAASHMLEDQIDGEAFLLLNADDLKEYGVKRGPALKLSKHILDAGRQAASTDDPKTNALHELVGPDGVLVITDGGSEQRFLETRKKLRKAGINATRFVATDHATASLQELERGCPREGDNGVKESCLAASKTGYGCTSTADQAMATSHLNALLAAKQRNSEWTAIFEDGALPAQVANWSSTFRRAWKKMPPNVQMVRLGWCQIDVLNYADPVIHQVHANVTGAVLTQRIGYGKFSARPFVYEPGGCTTAYIVHKDALEDLISLFPCCGAVDACYKWDFFKKVNPKTGVERGIEVMMSIDSHQRPSVNGLIEHHGLILQDLGL